MVSYPCSDMKVPVRPAPLPPGTGLRQSTSALDDWGIGGDPFSERTNRILSMQPGQPPSMKKKPPPRPPPPKFPQKNQRKQVPNRPTSLLSGLFNRNVSSQHSISTQQKKNTQAPITTASLIDLHSPSCSPTPTTRSSSDGLSVNSFGSDGSMSNNGQTPGVGSCSLFESGFEDDFDFFGEFSSSSGFTTPVNEQKDPWTVERQDPFSPPRQPNRSTVFSTQSDITSIRQSCIVSMPTIIRAKPGKVAAVPKLNEAAGSTSVTLFPITADSVRNEEFDDDLGKWSPPMPSIPPPPPPPEALLELETERPPLPPRPVQFQDEDLKKPYGVALYDYPGSHPDDLSLHVNDTVFLLHRVNSEWLYGQVDQMQGMFPDNFIRVVVPLPDSNQERRCSARMVTALYSFAAETWDDLEFQEGSSIYVISKINTDWLYGECRGKRGQFPASFVDRVPHNLPQRNEK